MRIAIRYYSKTGHMKKMGDAIAEVTGAEAKSIEEPITEPVDVLFIGAGVYAAVVDWRMKKFIRTLSPDKVKNVVCFCSAAILETNYKDMRKLLEKQGLHVDNREFHCRGSFSLLHRGHPNQEDLNNLKEFVKGLNL